MKKIRVLCALCTALITFALPAAAQSEAEQYQTACKQGHMKSCNNLGLMYDKGNEVPQDDTRAARLYTQACDGGEMNGCNNLGWLYFGGDGVPQDYARAAKFFTQACNGVTWMAASIWGQCTRTV